MTLSTYAEATPGKHRGGMLIESLVGLLIMGIVGAGTVHITARMNASQQQMALQDIAVREMRDLLMRHGSGGALDLCSGSHEIQLSQNHEPIPISVAGCTPVDATISLAGGTPVSVPSVRQPLVLDAEIPELGLVRVGGQDDDA